MSDSRGDVKKLSPVPSGHVCLVGAAAIPLTHRGLAHQVTFVTAHRADGQPEPDWQVLTNAA